MSAWQAWESVLEQMERDAHRAIELAASRVSADVAAQAQLAWTPPADLGALPDGLAARAAALLALQERAAALTVQSGRDVEHEIQALALTRTPVRSLYVDVTG